MARLTTTTTSARPDTAVQTGDEDEALTRLKDKEDVLDKEEILSDPVQDVVKDSLTDDSTPETSEDSLVTTSEDTSTATSEDASTATSEAPETETERDRVSIAAKRLKKALDEDQQETTTV